MQFSTEQLIEIVRRHAAECASVELDEVHRDTNLWELIGRESIDLLDLQFRIEKELRLRLNIGNMFSKSVRTDAAGALTPDSLDELACKFQFLPIDGLTVRSTPDDLMNLLTPLTMAKFIEFVARADNGSTVQTATASAAVSNG